MNPNAIFLGDTSGIFDSNVVSDIILNIIKTSAPSFEDFIHKISFKICENANRAMPVIRKYCEQKQVPLIPLTRVNLDIHAEFSKFIAGTMIFAISLFVDQKLDFSDEDQYY